MNDGYASREAARETIDGLGGQGDLRHQHDAAFPPRDNGSQCLEVDLGFAAACDAVQEDGSHW